MANQERNSEMVSLLSVDFINKTDTAYVAGIALSSLLMLPGLVAVWPMQLSLGDSSDTFADYAYLPGRVGGQILNGGVNAGDDLTLVSTAHATKGNIFVGNSTYDEVNNRLGIGTVSPAYPLDVVDRSRFRSGSVDTAGFWLADATPTNRAFIGLTNDGASSILGFYNASNWRMHIDSSGNVSIDTSHAGSYKLYINGSLQSTQLGEAWQNLSFNTGWGDLGSGYQGGQYKKFGDFIYLRGVVTRTSGVATLIATLPAGYRPPANILLPVVANGGFGYIDIATGGTITLTSGNPWVTLEGLFFSVL